MNGRLRRGATLGLALAALGGCSRSPALPTLEVRPQPFVQKVTAEGWLTAAKVTPVTVPSQVRSSVRLAWLAPEASQVKGADVVARFDGGDLEQSLGSGRSAYDGAGFRIVEAESTSAAEQAALRGQLERAKLELALGQRFQKTDDTLWSRHEIVEAQIDVELATDRRQHAELKGATQRQRVKSDLDLLGIERSQAQIKIDEARAGLAALEIRAPHAGVFTRAKDWRGEPVEVGAEMWRGSAVGEIPDLSRMQAEVFVLEADAGGVASGQRAEVALEARPELLYRARVERVDAVPKPREQGSPVQYFGITLALEGTHSALAKPGQRVRATLFVTRRDKALVVPRQAIERAGYGHRVFVRQGDGFAPRQVELGPGNRGLVVVVKGLAAGEVIALRPPGSATGDGKPGAGKGDQAARAAPSAGGKPP